MEILKTISFENEGNDCWIKKSFTLVSDFGERYLIYHRNVSGWCGDDDFSTIKIDENFDFKKFFESELDSADCYSVMRNWDLEKNGVDDVENLGEEKETDHILIYQEVNNIFDGTREQFRDCYFDNATNEEIIDWCHDMDFTLRINGKKIF